MRRAVLLAAGAGAVAAIAPAAGSGATAQVQAGDFAPPDVNVNAFLPSRVTVREGDRVRFAIRGFHTVTFPKRGTRPGPFQLPAGGPAPTTADAGGQPFWWAGQPQAAFNPAVFAPAGGTVVTKARTVNSGVPAGGDPQFTASFPKSGTYTYLCTIHPGMKGTVSVRPRRAAAPDPAVAEARAARERVQLRRQARRADRTADRVSTDAQVSVGFGAGAIHLYRFAPARSSVRVGSTVTFRMRGNREIHTVTFGPQDYLLDVAAKSFGPGVQVLDPRGSFPSDPPSAQPVPYTGATHGNGFLNSGLLASPPIPGPRSFRVRFDAPGTYPYICLVHPEMRGEVTVS